MYGKEGNKWDNYEIYFLPMGLIRKYFQNFHSYYVHIVPVVYHPFINL